MDLDDKEEVETLDAMTGYDYWTDTTEFPKDEQSDKTDQFIWKDDFADKYDEVRDDSGNVVGYTMKGGDKSKIQKLIDGQADWNVFIVEKITEYGDFTNDTNDKDYEPFVDDEDFNDDAKLSDKKPQAHDNIRKQEAREVLNNIGQVKFEYDQGSKAKEYVKKRIENMVSKYKLDPEKIEEMKIEMIPDVLRDTDPEAYGYLCYDTEGEDEHAIKSRGPGASGKKPDRWFGKTTRIVFLEYIVYRSV